MSSRSLLKKVWSVFIVIGIIGFLLQYFAFGETKSEDINLLLSSIISIILAQYISVLFHELGHLLFGAIAGFKFSSITVGGIHLHWDSIRRRLRLKFVTLNLFSGLVTMNPTADYALRWRWMMFVLGGAIGNGLLLLVIKLTYQYVPDKSFLSSVMMFAMFVSSLQGIFNLIPYETKEGFSSDGLQLLRFLQGGTHLQRMMALLLIHSFALEGKGCKDWNSKWVEDSLAVRDDSFSEAMANFYAYDWALDKKDIIRAEGYLNRALELVDKLQTPLTTSLYWSQAHFLAIYKNDAAVAREAFEKTATHPTPPELAFYPLRTEAAVFLAEGRFEEAKAKAQEGITVYKELGSPKYGQEELEQLEDILAKAENSLTSSSSIVA